MMNYNLSIAALVGTDIIDSKGYSIGTVRDFVYNHKVRDIQYVIIGFGGFLGAGDEYFAVAYSFFDLTDNGVLKLTLSPAENYIGNKNEVHLPKLYENLEIQDYNAYFQKINNIKGAGHLSD